MKHLDFNTKEELNTYLSQLVQVRFGRILPIESKKGVWIDGNVVMYDNVIIEKLDASSLQFCLTYGFAMDDKCVYCYGSTKADCTTFHSLSGTFAKDKNNVWYLKGIVKEADTESFVACDDGLQIRLPHGIFSTLFIPMGFGKDKESVFYYGFEGQASKVKDADSMTFVSMNDGCFGKDTNNIYYKKSKLPKANVASWRKLNELYSTDGERVYYMNRIVKGADINSFRISNNDIDNNIPQTEAYDDFNHYNCGEIKSIQ